MISSPGTAKAEQAINEPFSLGGSQMPWPGCFGLRFLIRPPDGTQNGIFTEEHLIASSIFVLNIKGPLLLKIFKMKVPLFTRELCIK